MKTSKAWKTAPISPTCEVQIGHGKLCDLPTLRAYPAAGGGWMALCSLHGLKHTEAPFIDALILQGETFS